MSSNLLDLPLRRTTRVDLSSVLSELIATQFSQHVEEFTDDLSRLTILRDHIVDPPIDASCLTKHVDYYTQLTYLTTKLPLDIGVEFEWYEDSSAVDRYALDDLSYERAYVLYNTAMTYAALALRENRATTDGLKRSNQQYQNGAGCIVLLEEYLQTTFFLKPEGLQPEFLSCIKSIMLAQAQECIWQKAVLDQMKDKLIAQLSQQVSIFYHQAVESLQQSTAMSTSWIHHLKLKEYHFAAAAQVRMSSSALSSNRYGEEVARLRRAKELCSQAQQHAPYVSKTVAQDLKGLTDHVRDTASRSEKDNDMIYVQAVPAPGALAAIVPQIMVKPAALPQIRDPLTMISKDDLLFHKLVPFVVRNVSDIYNQRKQELVTREIVNKIHALDLEMQALLQELGLPGSLTVLEQPLGLPQSLLTQSMEVHQRGGSKYLQGLLYEVATLAAANSELVEQIVDIMDEATMDSDEAEEEETVLSGYRKQIDQYQTFLEQAKASDQLVQTKLEQWASQIDLLASDEATLAKSIPNAKRTTLSREAESSTRRVRLLLDSWVRVCQERKIQIEQATSFSDTDDITPALIQFSSQSAAPEALSAADYEDILIARLASYSLFTQHIEVSAKTQDRLMNDLRTAHTSFRNTSTAQSSSSERERILQDLDTGYQKYREIIHNLEEGGTFYTDFHKALCRVSDEVSNAVKTLRDNRDLVLKTKRMSVRGEGNTSVQSPGRVVPGTWNPSAGIAFSKAGSSATARPQSTSSSSTPAKGTQSSTRESGTSHVFDATRHAIKFAPSKQ